MLVVVLVLLLGTWARPADCEYQNDHYHESPTQTWEPCLIVIVLVLVVGRLARGFDHENANEYHPEHPTQIRVNDTPPRGTSP